MKLNKKLYSLDGPYTKIAKQLNPYSSSPTTNIFRLLSDLYSSKIMESDEGYSAKELAALSLNLTQGRDFYSGEVLIEKNKIVLSEELIHRDHLFPASKGGLYAYGNVVITSQESNIEKSDMDPYEYYKLRFDKCKPTLFDTIDEAYAAITFLHNLYKTHFPHAAAFVDKSNTINFPMTWDSFSEAFKELFADNKEMEFMRRPSGGKKLKDDWGVNSEFWEPFRDESSELYNDYTGTSKEKSARASWYTAKRIQDTFDDISIYEIDFDELKNLFDEVAFDTSYESSQLGAMRRVMRIVANELGYEWKPPRKSN